MAIQLLSAVLGSDEEVAATALDFEGLSVVVLFTVVLVVVVVLGVVLAGFTEGSVAEPVLGCPVA